MSSTGKKGRAGLTEQLDMLTLISCRLEPSSNHAGKKAQALTYNRANCAVSVTCQRDQHHQARLKADVGFSPHQC